MFLMLLEERYPENYSLGVLTSAGLSASSSALRTHDHLRAVSNADLVSPNDLFIAGILPGLFIATVLVLYTMYDASRCSRHSDSSRRV